MIDPGALGTLLIYYQSVRAEEASANGEVRSPVRTRRSGATRSVRLSAARTLRTLADALDRPATRLATR